MELEIWKDVKDYEGYYQVSNLGRFRSLDRDIVKSNGIIQPKRGQIIEGNYIGTHDGYIDVKLCKGNKSITRKLHRLVAMTFMPLDNYDGMEVNHKDYNRINNRVDNLEWTTHIENIRHSSSAGRYKNNTSGCKNGRSNYTEDEIRNIRSLYDGGKTVSEVVAVLFPDLDYKGRRNKWSRISDICKRVTYSNII